MFAAFLLAAFMSADTQKQFFCFGAIMAAFCSILYGFMEWSVGGTPYIIVCLALRTVMGIGMGQSNKIIWNYSVSPPPSPPPA